MRDHIETEWQFESKVSPQRWLRGAALPEDADDVAADESVRPGDVDLHGPECAGAKPDSATLRPRGAP